MGKQRQNDQRQNDQRQNDQRQNKQRQDDQRLNVHRLIELKRIKIKICGLTCLEDIFYVNEVKPEFVGFVFAPSKRQVTIEKAVKMQEYLDPDIMRVGVFVNPKKDEVIHAAQQVKLDLIQLHGQEPTELIKSIQDEIGLKVIKAFSMNNTDQEPRTMIEKCNADYVLFDQGNGGTGKSFDWSLIPSQQKLSKRWFLAGGIQISNVREAMKYQPDVIDISSGVETNGKKDLKKMIEIVKAIRDGCKRQGV